MRAESLRILALVAGTAVVAGDVRADLVLPGKRNVRVETEVTFGPYEVKEPPAAWRFFAAADGPTSEPALQRIVSGERTPYHRYGTKVVAVRADVLEAFEAASAERGEAPVHGFLEEWVPKPGVAVSAAIGGRTSLSESSPVRTRVERWEVTSIDGDELTLRRADTRDLDAEGAPVRRSAVLGGANGLLVGLAGAAFVALVLLARRRAAGPA